MKNINEGVFNWIVNLIANKNVKKAEQVFSNDKELQRKFREFREAEEQLSKTWSDVCKENKGTEFDCDKMMDRITQIRNTGTNTK